MKQDECMYVLTFLWCFLLTSVTDSKNLVCNNLQRYSLKQEVMNKLKKVLFLILNKLWWGQQVCVALFCVCLCVCASVILRQWQFSLLVTWQDLFWGLSLLFNSSGGKRGRQSRSTRRQQGYYQTQTQFLQFGNYREKLFFTKKSFALKPLSFGRT